MSLYEKLCQIYPELTPDVFWDGIIKLQDDSNGQGPYIKEWTYHKPQPTQEQLDALDDNS